MSDHWHLTIDITDTGISVSDGVKVHPVEADVDSVRTALTNLSVTVSDGTTIPSEEYLTEAAWICLDLCNRPGPPASVAVNAPGLRWSIDRLPLYSALAAFGIDPATVTVNESIRSDTSITSPLKQTQYQHQVRSPYTPVNGPKKKKTILKRTAVAASVIAGLVFGVLAIVYPYRTTTWLPESVPAPIREAMDKANCKTGITAGREKVEKTTCEFNTLFDDSHIVDPQTGKSYSVDSITFVNSPDRAARVSEPDQNQREIPVGVRLPENQAIRITGWGTAGVSHAHDDVYTLYVVKEFDRDDPESLLRAIGLVE